jgi:broad specificity phosphatase PhoE
VEIVLTSPLTRALQTANGLFGAHPSAPRMEVAPLLRERVENSCDIGRPPAALAAQFPSFDLSRLDGEWWHKEGQPDARGICIEPVPAVQERCARFKAELMARPERVVALVGHGTFFLYLTGRTMANCEVLELRW